MKSLHVLAVAASAALASGASAQVNEISAKSAEFLSRYEADGDAVSCLMLRRIDSIKGLDDKLLLVETTGRDFYVNEPPRGCPGIARGNHRIVLSTSEPNLCSGQIIDIVDNSSGFSLGSCSLGDFQPVKEKAPASPS